MKVTDQMKAEADALLADPNTPQYMKDFITAELAGDTAAANKVISDLRERDIRAVSNIFGYGP